MSWRDLDGLVDVFDRALGAGKDRRARGLRHALARDLVAQQRHRLRRRADERDLAIPTHFREVRVLGEEAVAGVDRIGAGDFGGGNDALDPQVAVGARRWTDAHRAIGVLEPRAVLVGDGVDAHGLDAETLRGADDAKGNLAAVGDQDSIEHEGSGVGVSGFRLRQQGSDCSWLSLNPDP
jgi:hypothetical protein